MRAAMVHAEVGDDVYGDDPTVNRLQRVMAERAGFEAALYFPSGTQCNLAALMAHCQRGDEYLVGQLAHTYTYEAGGAAVLGSIQPQPIENEADGSLSLARIEAAIKPADHHFARSRLLALENTIGGKVLPRAYVDKATALAHERGLRTHLDGARLFNAAVKLGVELSALTRGFDSVSVCLSKGLRGLEGLAIEVPQTNIVWCQVQPSLVTKLSQAFEAHGVLASMGPVLRLVTHLDVTRADCERLVEVIRGAA